MPNNAGCEPQRVIGPLLVTNFVLNERYLANELIEPRTSRLSCVAPAVD